MLQIVLDAECGAEAPTLNEVFAFFSFWRSSVDTREKCTWGREEKRYRHFGMGAQ